MLTSKKNPKKHSTTGSNIGTTTATASTIDATNDSIESETTMSQEMENIMEATIEEVTKPEPVKKETSYACTRCNFTTRNPKIKECASCNVALEPEN